MSDVYSHQQSFASVQFLDLQHLKMILTKDREKLTKLWTLLAFRLIVLNYEKLPQFNSLTQDQVKMFCKMCTIQIYSPGDIVDLKSGGVMFRGGLSPMS